MVAAARAERATAYFMLILFGVWGVSFGKVRSGLKNQEGGKLKNILLFVKTKNAGVIATGNE